MSNPEEKWNVDWQIEIYIVHIDKSLDELQVMVKLTLWLVQILLAQTKFLSILP